jgi:hypothetical protein
LSNLVRTWHLVDKWLLYLIVFSQHTVMTCCIWECPDQNKLCSIEFPMCLPCFNLDILISLSTYCCSLRWNFVSHRQWWHTHTWLHCIWFVSKKSCKNTINTCIHTLCNPYTCGIGPGKRLVSTKYLATLEKATAVPTRRSAGLPEWAAGGPGALAPPGSCWWELIIITDTILTN